MTRYPSFTKKVAESGDERGEGNSKGTDRRRRARDTGLGKVSRRGKQLSRVHCDRGGGEVVHKDHWSFYFP